MPKNKAKPTKKKPVVNKRLNQKQEMFCRLYIIDLDAIGSYRKVYKCSYNAAKAAAYRALANVRIQERLAQLKFESVDRVQNHIELEISADKVLQEVAQRAYTNIADFIEINAQGQAVLNLQALPRHIMAGIKKIKYTDLQPISVVEMGIEIEREAVKTEIELHDNGKYLEMLMKHLGILKEKVEVAGMNELIEALNAGRQRVAAHRDKMKALEKSLNGKNS